MTWKVIWLPSAERSLTNIWIASRSRKLLHETLSDLEGRLTNNPLNAGESRSDNRRIFFIDSLVSEFIVDPAQGKVFVLRLRLRRQP